MRISRKFQEGGPMPEEQAPQGAAPAEQGGGDPMQDLIQGATQAMQSGDCNVAMQVCQMLVQLAGGDQGQPAPEQQEAPAPAEGEPVYRAGGRLVRRINY